MQLKCCFVQAKERSKEDTLEKKLPIDFYDITAATPTDAATQCELLDAPPINANRFDIADKIQRRALVYRIYYIFIAQNVLGAGVMSLYLYLFDLSIGSFFYLCCNFASMAIYLVLYWLRQRRRYAPWNYATLVFITLIFLVQETAYAALYQSLAVLVLPPLLIVQLLALIAYTKFLPWRLTHFYADVLLVALAVGAYFWFRCYWNAHNIGHICVHATINAIYVAYDTQQQLTVIHGYDLQAHEHIYGLGNLFADWPLLYWRILREFFFDHIANLIKFLTKYLKADVC